MVNREQENGWIDGGTLRRFPKALPLSRLVPRNHYNPSLRECRRWVVAVIIADIRQSSGCMRATPLPLADPRLCFPFQCFLETVNCWTLDWDHCGFDSTGHRSCSFLAGVCK